MASETFTISFRQCAITGCKGVPRIKKGFDWLCRDHRRKLGKEGIERFGAPKKPTHRA